MIIISSSLLTVVTLA